MPATKYTYSIQNDFPNHRVDLDSLTKEINASSIITALSYISTAGDVCDIWFVDVLSGGDQTTLNSVVASHSGDPIVYTNEAYAQDPLHYKTTSTRFLKAIRLDIPNAVSSAYRISWSFEWGIYNSNTANKTLVKLDGTTELAEYDQLSPRVGVGLNSTSGFARVDLTEGPHYVDILLASSSPYYYVSIGNMKLEAHKSEE